MQRHHEVRVGPFGDGWYIECDEVSQPIIFLSAASAEQHGRSLATAIAKTGVQVRLLISDRSGSVIAAARCDGDRPEAWLSVV